MLIVTGTKRSGTSMWMQILRAAGFRLVGDAFPRDWEKTLKQANPAGFYESSLRHGIYYATNPHPDLGVYLFPEDTQRFAVKVFIPGLVRSDRAFIWKVIGSMRPLSEYVASIQRLYAMEDAQRREKQRGRGKEARAEERVRVPPDLEWWMENYALISDLLTRRYPAHLVAYDSVWSDPERHVAHALRWLGAPDVAAGVAAVRPELRTQHAPSPASETSRKSYGRQTVRYALNRAQRALCDELYERVRASRPLERSLIRALNAQQDVLAPRVARALRAAERSQRELSQRAVRRVLGRRQRAGDTREPG